MLSGRYVGSDDVVRALKPNNRLTDFVVEPLRYSPEILLAFYSSSRKGNVIHAARSLFFLKLAQVLLDPCDDSASSSQSSAFDESLFDLQKALLEPLGVTKRVNANDVRDATLPFLKYAWFLVRMSNETVEATNFSSILYAKHLASAPFSLPGQMISSAPTQLGLR